MKCPYAASRCIKSKTIFDYNETGEIKQQNEVIINAVIFTNCFESECGAWKDGRCQYKD